MCVPGARSPFKLRQSFKPKQVRVGFPATTSPNLIQSELILATIERVDLTATKASVEEFLHQKFAKLYHACNLLDFKSYCARGALLSKRQLKTLELEFTRFYSEKSDQVRNLDDRIFGNLSDFGGRFWHADAALPNVYGPITIIFGRSIWEHCTDIAITRKTASSADWDLASDRIGLPELADCYQKNGFYWGLKRGLQGLEVSISNNLLRLSLAERVVVEPIQGLANVVRKSWQDSGLDASKVIERQIHAAPSKRELQRLIFDGLLDWARENAGSYANLEGEGTNVPAALADWFASLPEARRRALGSWLTYTYDGTIRPLGAENALPRQE